MGIQASGRYRDIHMINYLAITSATANWLVLHAGHRKAIDRELRDLASAEALFDTVLVVGSLRAAASRDASLLAMWNTEYLSSSRAENWGFVRLRAPHGLLTQGAVAPAAFERVLHVTNYRSQGMLLPEAFIHRSHGDNMHTCVSGGSDTARQASLAYFEGDVPVRSSKRKTLFFVGPSRGRRRAVEADLRPLVEQLETWIGRLPAMVEAADQLLDQAVQRPAADSALFVSLTDRFRPAHSLQAVGRSPAVTVPPLTEDVSSEDAYQAENRTYAEWIAPGSSLTDEQRLILESDILIDQPLRLTGPAGSGKSLLMQLLAMRILRRVADNGRSCQVLYVVHNAAMMNSIVDRFLTLGADDFLLDDQNPCRLMVQTLFEFALEVLGGEEVPLIDKDAAETKSFQHTVVYEALHDAIKGMDEDPDRYPVLSQVAQSQDLLSAFAELVVSEIGVAIKGHGLTGSQERYVRAEHPISRLHGLLNESEREVIYDVFRAYHDYVFEVGGLLDSDDLALTLLSRLRTPLWNMNRKQQGFDYLFVDETHLFNENERRLFPLLTKKDTGNLPIALALDQAQELRGSMPAGFGLLGLDAISDQGLRKVYRSTPAILRLAFDLIQRTTDLFGADFPDFTDDTQSLVPDDHKHAAPPLVVTGGTVGSIGRFVVKRADRLRKGNLRQIGVIVHADRYWDDVVNAFRGSSLPFMVLTRRGERLDTSRPLVALARPTAVGGQEFDAVIAVGLEQGVVPPEVEGGTGLVAALEQQALREMYLSFTRARYQLVIANSVRSSPSPLLRSAIDSRLLQVAGRL